MFWNCDTFPQKRIFHVPNVTQNLLRCQHVTVRCAVHNDLICGYTVHCETVRFQRATVVKWSEVYFGEV